jgi:hypothetical protein
MAAIILAVVLGGCTQNPDAPPEAMELRLECSGANNATAALEYSYLGSCWGHIGHHTYWLERVIEVHALNVSMFVVEAEVAGMTDGDIGIEASMDGRSWDFLAGIRYPYTGTGYTEERHPVAAHVATAPTPARFLRIHMPRSSQDGLAGYLDATNIVVRGMPSEAPPLAPPTRSDCADGVMESYFAAHPCWFGGRDEVDAGEPSHPHLGHYPTGSYYDAPSFFHTHVATGDAFVAEVRVQHWRSANQLALCTVMDEQRDLPLQPRVVVQASPDGRNWTDAASGQAEYDQALALTGSLPPGTNLVRFAAAMGPGGSHPPCHHPVAFVVESRIEPA